MEMVHGNKHVLVFRGLPIPPSSNNQYSILRVNGVHRHVPTRELKNFRKAMGYYFLENANALKFAREILAGYPLKVAAAFGFERSRLISKEGYFKKIDVSNRLKALHDALAEALLIDDCCFVEVSAVKYAVQSEADEQVSVEICATDFEEKMIPPEAN